MDKATVQKTSCHLEPLDPHTLVGQSGYAFAGIGDNERFKDTLKEMGLAVQGFRPFPDHHSYSDRDLKEILADQTVSPAQYLVTTEKDFYRLYRWLPLSMPLLVVGVEIRFASEFSAKFEELILKVME